MHVIEQDDNMFIGTVTVEKERNVMSINSSKEDEQWVETIQINKNDVKVTLDTGAECNVMSERVYKLLNIARRLQRSSCKLVTYSGHKMAP